MMLWYLLVAEAIVTSSPGFVREINTEVQNGEIAYKLNKPYSYILYHFAKSFSRRIITFFAAFIIGAILVYFLVGGFDFKIYSLPFLIIIIFLAMALDFFISMSIALLSFWLEDSNSLRWIYDKLLFTIGGMLVPLEIFPIWLSKIATILPFSYIAYSPAKLFVRFNLSDFFSVFAVQIGYILLFSCLTWLIYQKGIRRLNVNGG
jgi:ABC-2 type transport system permease protein